MSLINHVNQDCSHYQIYWYYPIRLTCHFVTISCTALSHLRPTGYFNKITYYYNFLSQVILAQNTDDSQFFLKHLIIN